MTIVNMLQKLQRLYIEFNQKSEEVIGFRGDYSIKKYPVQTQQTSLLIGNVTMKTVIGKVEDRRNNRYFAYNTTLRMKH